jgi:hypothetical protein
MTLQQQWQLQREHVLVKQPAHSSSSSDGSASTGLLAAAVSWNCGSVEELHCCVLVE